MNTVLLTNGQQRKTLAAARSLGKKGLRIIVAEETMMNPAAFSKYCYKALLCPSPKKFPEKYFQWLYTTICKYRCHVVFPMDDDSMEVVMKNYERLKSICKIPLPDKNSYFIASDKGCSIRLAKESGTICPETVYIDDLAELENKIKNLEYPAVIKPRKSSGARGIRIVNNKENLLKEYIKIHEKYPYPIIQQYIGLGERYDVCLLYDDGKVKAHFIQKELRHFPINMGPSTLQESIEFPELLEISFKIMEGLRWHGVVELEFMRDCKDQSIKFMEINPRFWASLQTSINAGVDFPWILYQLAMEEVSEEIKSYKIGVKCRWLLPGDILHFVLNRERKKMYPPFWGGKKYGIRDDILSKEDPIPLLGFILACFRYVLDIKMWRFIFKR